MNGAQFFNFMNSTPKTATKIVAVDVIPNY